MSFIKHFGAGAASRSTWSLFAAIAALTVVDRTAPVTAARIEPTPRAGALAWLQGPWPLVAGAVGARAAQLRDAALSGRPWGVTVAFALWGAKSRPLPA